MQQYQDHDGSGGSSDNPVKPQSDWDGLDLGKLLTLEHIGDMHSRSQLTERNRNGRVFGGQLLGQALRAARASVDDARVPTALQVLYMHGAQVGQPIDFHCEVMQEGKRFSSRRVTASQQDRLLIDAHATFQIPAPNYAHALPPYETVPAPEDVLSLEQIKARGEPHFGDADWPDFERSCLELRLVAPERYYNAVSSEPRMAYWVRLRQPLNDDPAVHAAALAYLSDFWINRTAITHHVSVREAYRTVYSASLNHSLWLHRAGRADGWLLFSCESPNLQDGRALTHARVYDQTMTLRASVVQECLVARRD